MPFLNTHVLVTLTLYVFKFCTTKFVGLEIFYFATVFTLINVYCLLSSVKVLFWWDTQRDIL